MAKSRAACGTVAGYQQHRVRGEDQCGDCRAAYNDYQIKRRHGLLPPLAERPCQQCGELFAPKRRRTAKTCDSCSGVGPPTPRVCKDCAVPVGKSAQRCDTCRNDRRRASEAEREKQRHRDPLERKRAHSRWVAKRRQYLEAVCLPWPFGPTLAETGPIHGPTEPPKVSICGFCCKVVPGTKKWCSGPCMRYGSKSWETSSPLDIGECLRCGKPYCRRFKHANNGMCSAECTKRAHKAAEKRRRRVARRNGQSERYTTREIADRDGWRCHLCGKKVPDRPYKARDADPTVDHLVPVSAGGDDVRSNVALAHNLCNMRRSNHGPAQLRLIA